jgi:hypothetical protein
VDLDDEQPCLVDLVADHGVARAPVELERHAGECELAHEVVRAAARVRERRRERRAADLRARELLQAATVLQRREVPVATCHVSRRIERRGAGEQVRMASDEQQHLLPAHRAADRVHTVRVDVDAVLLGDLRHARQVGDLARRAPRVRSEPPALALRVDDGEAPETRQDAEEARVLARAQPAAVGRDDERDRPAVVVPRQHEERATQPPVVRPVVDDADLHRRPGRGDRRRDGQQDGQGQRRRSEAHACEATARIAKMALWIRCSRLTFTSAAPSGRSAPT